ncbi:hypothetical protein A3Q56_03787 [Intoshia linei]|uniref:Uncharacterized protein n=1 Tax=Intoshia linei TaxID=1819745 RepID=A0A177B2V4_9BILA|nr:hypothetical protein A3Q56_03787 [Intoshia linei]
MSKSNINMLANKLGLKIGNTLTSPKNGKFPPNKFSPNTKNKNTGILRFKSETDSSQLLENDLDIRAKLPKGRRPKSIFVDYAEPDELFEEAITKNLPKSEINIESVKENEVFDKQKSKTIENTKFNKNIHDKKKINEKEEIKEIKTLTEITKEKMPKYSEKESENDNLSIDSLDTESKPPKPTRRYTKQYSQIEILKQRQSIEVLKTEMTGILKNKNENLTQNINKVDKVNETEKIDDLNIPDKVGNECEAEKFEKLENLTIPKKLAFSGQIANNKEDSKNVKFKTSIITKKPDIVQFKLPNNSIKTVSQNDEKQKIIGKPQILPLKKKFISKIKNNDIGNNPFSTESNEMSENVEKFQKIDKLEKTDKLEKPEKLDKLEKIETTKKSKVETVDENAKSTQKTKNSLSFLSKAAEKNDELDNEKLNPFNKDLDYKKIMVDSRPSSVEVEKDLKDKTSKITDADRNKRKFENEEKPIKQSFSSKFNKFFKKDDRKKNSLAKSSSSELVEKESIQVDKKKKTNYKSSDNERKALTKLEEEYKIEKNIIGKMKNKNVETHDVTETDTKVEDGLKNRKNELLKNILSTIQSTHIKLDIIHVKLTTLIELANKLIAEDR